MADQSDSCILDPTHQILEGKDKLIGHVTSSVSISKYVIYQKPCHLGYFYLTHVFKEYSTLKVIFPHHISA